MIHEAHRDADLGGLVTRQEPRPSLSAPREETSACAIRQSEPLPSDLSQHLASLSPEDVRAGYAAVTLRAIFPVNLGRRIQSGEIPP